jgi:membrane protein implicated in regulation of membrane protease activity
MPSARVVIKYTLLQIPAAILLILVLAEICRRVDLPSWLFWIIIIGWIAKDVLLFPLVWRSYDSKRDEGTHPMKGGRGIAVERLAPTGYVRVGGELWKGRLSEGVFSIEKGQKVNVKEIRGLTVIVEPEDET